MMARIVPEASIALHLASNRLDEAAILANAAVAEALRAAVAELVAAARRCATDA